jgi:hypothetical protein
MRKSAEQSEIVLAALKLPVLHGRSMLIPPHQLAMAALGPLAWPHGRSLS